MTIEINQEQPAEEPDKTETTESESETTTVETTEKKVEELPDPDED